MNFFDINNSEIKNRLIFENNLVFAFPSNRPIVSGHILICPKRIVATINELTQEEILAMFDLQKKLRSSLLKVFDAEGFNYAWNEGVLSGQTALRVDPGRTRAEPFLAPLLRLSQRQVHQRGDRHRAGSLGGDR